MIKPVVLYPVHHNPRFHGQKSILLLFIHEMPCFRGQSGTKQAERALHYAKILASLKIKNGISLTPLNCALNAFTFALNDSADALVERLSK